jgi:hypothetical protein
VPARGAIERFTLVAPRANAQPAFSFCLKDPDCRVARARC